MITQSFYRVYQQRITGLKLIADDQTYKTACKLVMDKPNCFAVFAYDAIKSQVPTQCTRVRFIRQGGAV